MSARYLTDAEKKRAADALREHLAGRGDVALSGAHKIVLAAIGSGAGDVETMATSRVLRSIGWYKYGFIGIGYDREPLYAPGQQQ